CAHVFEIRCPGNDRWAVKCYQRPLPGLLHHYQHLRMHLLPLDLPYLVECLYVETGVSVRGRWFPAAQMRWVDGEPLNAFVQGAADQPAALRQFAKQWLRMAQALRRAGVAHGGLQHDHVYVCHSAPGGPPALRLLDYDGMFVPALAGRLPVEVGHANYQ